MATLERLLNRLWAYTLSAVLMGGYIYQFFEHENPCPLCMLQRLGMLGVAFAILFNLRFGFKQEHYGLALLASSFGMSVSLRQIALHICPQFAPYGEPVLHYDLYVWSFVVFFSSILATSILLMLRIFTRDKPVAAVWSFWDKLAFALVFLLSLANTISTLLECGVSAC